MTQGPIPTRTYGSTPSAPTEGPTTSPYDPTLFIAQKASDTIDVTALSEADYNSMMDVNGSVAKLQISLLLNDPAGLWCECSTVRTSQALQYRKADLLLHVARADCVGMPRGL